MFRRTSMFLAAGILATFAACHQAKPATSVSDSSYQAQQTTDTAAGQDASAREVPGYAPSAKRPARELTTKPAAVTAAPAPAPQDDPMRQFDIP